MNSPTATASYPDVASPDVGAVAEQNSVFVTSFAQQRLWLLDQLEPDSPLYNIPTGVRLSGPLNVAALQRSLDAIIERHEPLRTTLAMQEAQLVQIIAPPRSLELPMVDLGELAESQREGAAMRLAAEEVRRPFNLAQDLMLRARLIRLHRGDHILVLTMHHIASDGWSVGVLLRELGTCYGAFANGDSAVGLAELAIQYADFSVWQRQWLSGEVLEKQLSYWKRQLAGAPPLLELPFDRPRLALQSYRGAMASVRLDKNLTEALRALSRREDCTFFMTMLAGFQTLVSRYTGRHDIVVGSPIANRNRAEVEGLIGYFVNTLVMRTDLSGDPTFRELLGRVREVALGAYAHQDLPFEKLVEELQPPRDQSYTPLFQVMFILQNAPLAPLAMPGLVARPVDLDTATSKFDLTLNLWETPEGLTGWLEYATDLFESSTINRMLGHWQVLMRAIADDPSRHLSELPLLTAVERRQLVEEWNDTAKAYPPFPCVHQGIETQAERTPEAVALVFEGGQLTYQELNRRANQLAHHLQKLGVGPETLVGICMERSLEMVVALLAIVKAGGAYVPLDPDFPKDRLAFILADAQTPVLLTQESIWSKLQIPVSGLQVIALDKEWESIAKQSPANPAAAVTAENAAYVIYTSGSTGQPKGVVVSHRAVVNFLNSMRTQPGLTAQDTLLAVTTLSFDIAGLELLLPLVVGAKAVIAHRETAMDGNRLARQLKECGATVMQATPATWRLLLESGWSGGAHVKILCGGEAWSEELARQLLPCCASLWNMYGPTETTIWSAVSQIEAGQPVLIGGPIANTQLYVLDDHLQPVPVGVAGELHIGGDGLARGYLKRPELTAAKFIPSSFSRAPGARLYKTGDLACYRADGRIEFLGRTDHQVKLRGFRIELGEIESVLRQHPNLREAVVVAREESSGDKRLVGYVVPQQSPAPPVSDLRRFLQEKLPDYMVPSAFVELEAFPLTPNGKVDRRALPAPEDSKLELPGTFVAPRTAAEKKLAEIWAQILRVDRVGVRNNFFDLGGHSLLAVRLVGQIEKILGKKLPLATIFEAPTIEQLAAILRDKGWSPARSCLVAVQPAGSKPPFICVPPDDGTVLLFADLARHLGKDQPFFGLEPVAMWGKQLVAHYVEQIQAVQPEGPYYLGGRCGGGLIALQIAEQLLAQGQKVALLVLFGVGYPPGYKKTRFHALRRLVYLLRHNPSHILTLRNLMYILQVRAFMFKRKFKKRLAYIFSGVRTGSFQGLIKTDLEASLYAVNKVYPGRITLFETNDFTRPAWSKLAAGGVDCHSIPTGHFTMLREPYVRQVAVKLKACLEAARVES